MNADEITGWRTALAYLLHGDDPAKRWRLAAILATGVVAVAIVVLTVVAVALSP